MPEELSVESIKRALQVLSEQQRAAAVQITPKFLVGHVRLTPDGWQMYHAVKGWVACDEPR